MISQFFSVLLSVKDYVVDVEMINDLAIKMWHCRFRNFESVTIDSDLLIDTSCNGLS